MNFLPLTKVDLDTMLKLLYGNISQGDQHLLGKECCVLSEVDICSGYRFAFLAPSVSAKTTIHGLTDCLFHNHGISYSITCD